VRGGREKIYSRIVRDALFFRFVIFVAGQRRRRRRCGKDSGVNIVRSDHPHLTVCVCVESLEERLVSNLCVYRHQGSIYCLLCLSVWIGLWPHLPHIPSGEKKKAQHSTMHTHTHNQNTYNNIRVEKRKPKKNKYTQQQSRNEKQNKTPFFLFLVFPDECSRFYFPSKRIIRNYIFSLWFLFLFCFGLTPVMILSLWGFFFWISTKHADPLCTQHTHDDSFFYIVSDYYCCLAYLFIVRSSSVLGIFFFSFLMVRQDRMLHCHYSQKGKYNNQQMSFEELLFANNWIYISQRLTHTLLIISNSIYRRGMYSGTVAAYVIILNCLSLPFRLGEKPNKRKPDKTV
jgi:hypothetical protein